MVACLWVRFEAASVSLSDGVADVVIFLPSSDFMYLWPGFSDCLAFGWAFLLGDCPGKKVREKSKSLPA